MSKTWAEKAAIKRASGICVKCSEPAKPGYTKCQRHLDARKRDGACRECGKECPGLKTCPACSERSRLRKKELRRERREKGLCFRCGMPAIPNNCQCETCWYKHTAQRHLGQRSLWVDLKQKMLDQGHRCVYSGLPIREGVDAALDHRVPRSRGGPNTIDNLQWVHYSVNTLKARFSEQRFLELVCTIARHQQDSPGVDSRGHQGCRTVRPPAFHGDEGQPSPPPHAP